VNVFPTIVCDDFENAIQNAVITVLPGCEVKACRFHLGQSWWWKIQSLGLSKQYGKKGSEVSHFLQNIFVLSILPPAEVNDRFALNCISSLPNGKRGEQFCDYLLENYIDADSAFPTPVWSECSASSLRTIKARESFHAQFNWLFSMRILTFLFLYLHCKKYRMRPTSKWEPSLHEDLNNQLQSRKRT